MLPSKKGIAKLPELQAVFTIVGVPMHVFLLAIYVILAALLFANGIAAS